MKPIAVIQHQANGDEGFIYEWSQLHGLELVKWYVNKRDSFPPASNFGVAIVLGGEANVTDVEKLNWMKTEIGWIQSAIELSIPCFGICLGAQLLASILHASVVPLIQAEQGVEELYLSNKGVFIDFNLRQLSVFQAHSYRFEIPESATNYAATEKCGQQLFIHDSGKILGIQCHLEWSLQKYQQLFPDTISGKQGMVFSEDKTKHLLFYLLDRFFISRQF